MGGEKVGNSSAFTIFTIWGAIVGTSVLTVPWAISRTGFGTSIIVFLLIALIAFYTCHLITKNAAKLAEKQNKTVLPEFRIVIKHYLGLPARDRKLLSRQIHDKTIPN